MNSLCLGIMLLNFSCSVQMLNALGKHKVS